MKKNRKILIVIAIIVGLFIFLVMVKKKENNKDMNLYPKTDQIPFHDDGNATVIIENNRQHCKPNYITPKHFGVGPLRKMNHPTANVCTNTSILYPLNQIGVEYGKGISINCPCAQFIRPP